MEAFFDERQLGHEPEIYFRWGAPTPHPEQPERARLIRRVLEEEGFPTNAPRDHGTGRIEAVHDPAYVAFLRDAHARFRAEAGPEPLAIPTHHPGPRRGREPSGIMGQMGWWMADTSTPLTESSFEAAYWSAQTAVEAAEAVAGGARAAYALCRPPGHHAMRACANGFCFFNNAAIAAHRLAARFGRVALLDVDVHTGNGSLDIFHERGDVLFVSLHPDPREFPTWFLGHADDRGSGEGEGATLNLLLPFGADDDAVLARLAQGLEAVSAFGAAALVVSLGFDMARDDPLKAVAVTPEGFARMAHAVAGAGLPTALVQEGGYLGPSLADNARAFLTAFRDAAGATSAR